MLSEILDPFDKLEGGTNLATMFASSKNSKKTGLSQSQRRAMADTCKMRYATLPHTCLCSDVARTEEPWAEKITFCPVGNESRQVLNSVEDEGNCILILTCRFATAAARCSAA